MRLTEYFRGLLRKPAQPAPEAIPAMAEQRFTAGQLKKARIWRNQVRHTLTHFNSTNPARAFGLFGHLNLTLGQAGMNVFSQDQPDLETPEMMQVLTFLTTIYKDLKVRDDVDPSSQEVYNGITQFDGRPEFLKPHGAPAFNRIIHENMSRLFKRLSAHTARLEALEAAGNLDADETLDNIAALLGASAPTEQSLLYILFDDSLRQSMAYSIPEGGQDKGGYQAMAIMTEAPFETVEASFKRGSTFLSQKLIKRTSKDPPFRLQVSDFGRELITQNLSRQSREIIFGPELKPEAGLDRSIIVNRPDFKRILPIARGIIKAGRLGLGIEAGKPGYSKTEGTLVLAETLGVPCYDILEPLRDVDPDAAGFDLARHLRQVRQRVRFATYSAQKLGLDAVLLINEGDKAYRSQIKDNDIFLHDQFAEADNDFFDNKQRLHRGLIVITTNHPKAFGAALDNRAAFRINHEEEDVQSQHRTAVLLNALAYAGGVTAERRARLQEQKAFYLLEQMIDSLSFREINNIVKDLAADGLPADDKKLLDLLHNTVEQRITAFTGKPPALIKPPDNIFPELWSLSFASILPRPLVDLSKLFRQKCSFAGRANDILDGKNLREFGRFVEGPLHKMNMPSLFEPTDNGKKFKKGGRGDAQVIFLYGDKGTGKKTMTFYLSKALGFRKYPVILAPDQFIDAKSKKFDLEKFTGKFTELQMSKGAANARPVALDNFAAAYEGLDEKDKKTFSDTVNDYPFYYALENSSEDKFPAYVRTKSPVLSVKTAPYSYERYLKYFKTKGTLKPERDADDAYLLRARQVFRKASGKRIRFLRSSGWIPGYISRQYILKYPHAYAPDKAAKNFTLRDAFGAVKQIKEHVDMVLQTGARAGMFERGTYLKPVTSGEWLVATRHFQTGELARSVQKLRY